MNYYNDYPQCLPRYSWLVKEGLREAARAFNDGDRPTCKVCGGEVPRKDWESHVSKHAVQLRLALPSPEVTRHALYADVRDTIVDSLALRLDGEAFDGDLPTLLAAAIVPYVQEGSAGEARFCEDCQPN